MNFFIVAKNKLDIYYKEGVKEYEKRLTSYCKIKMTSAAQNKHYKIKICQSGQMYSSEEFAEKIHFFENHSIVNVSFIVDEGFESGDEKICLSAMELSEGAKTLVLYEQIYRAYCILRGTPYHK